MPLETRANAYAVAFRRLTERSSRIPISSQAHCVGEIAEKAGVTSATVEGRIRARELPAAVGVAYRPIVPKKPALAWVQRMIEIKAWPSLLDIAGKVKQTRDIVSLILSGAERAVCPAKNHAKLANPRVESELKVQRDLENWALEVVPTLTIERLGWWLDFSERGLRKQVEAGLLRVRLVRHLGMAAALVAERELAPWLLEQTKRAAQDGLCPVAAVPQTLSLNFSRFTVSCG